MLQRDYILEMIVRFAEALARALKLAVLQRDIRGCEEVEQEVAGLLELDSSTALALSPESLVTIMSLSGMADSTAEYVAYALDRVADAYEDLGKPETADIRRLQAEAVADAFGCDLSHVPSELDEVDQELFG